MHRFTLGVLLIFYLSSIAGLLVSVIPSHKQWAFAVSPFQKQSALDSLQAAPDRYTRIIRRVNSRDPEVLYALAQAGKKDLFEEAVALDPYNSGYHKQLVGYLIESGRTADVAKQIRSFATGLVSGSDAGVLSSIDFASPVFVAFYTNEHKELLTAATPLGYAKLFYFLGLAALPKDPAVTKSLWTLAKNLAPAWSYFSIELASLEHFALNDEARARVTLTRCMNNHFAKRHCGDVLVSGIPPIGSLQLQITTIRAL